MLEFCKETTSFYLKLQLNAPSLVTTAVVPCHSFRPAREPPGRTRSATGTQELDEGESNAAEPLRAALSIYVVIPGLYTVISGIHMFSPTPPVRLSPAARTQRVHASTLTSPH